MWNATGFPVASLPGGFGRDSRLPVGISVIGPRGADARVLQIGIDLQEHALHPPGIADPAAEPAWPATGPPDKLDRVPR